MEPDEEQMTGVRRDTKAFGRALRKSLRSAHKNLRSRTLNFPETRALQIILELKEG